MVSIKVLRKKSRPKCKASFRIFLYALRREFRGSAKWQKRNGSVDDQQ